MARGIEGIPDGVGKALGEIRASRMFSFITKDGSGRPDTWNPLGGRCPYDCVYCWAKALVKQYDMAKYRGIPIIDQKQIKRSFPPDSFVFCCDMRDMFSPDVRDDLIRQILKEIGQKQGKYLLLTKNPQRYLYFLNQMPINVVLGATVENNRRYSGWSKAPAQDLRLISLLELRKKTQLPIFVSVEPIMDFDIPLFTTILVALKPWGVGIGFDNYGHHLTEPSLAKTTDLIDALEISGVTVYRKTLRKAWDEK